MPLPEPPTQAGAVGLKALLAEPRRAVLGLDFDGTLAPIVERPEDARALAPVAATLGVLGRHLAGVAIITGRPAATAVEYADLVADPDGDSDLVVLGAYGRERWTARTGEITAPPVPEGVDEVRRKLPALLENWAPGIYVEDKGAALVVHTRRAEEPTVALGRLQGPMAALAERHGLVVEQAKLALELRPPGFDKGAALLAFVAERDARTVVFAGDDFGDLPAYDAVDELRAGGLAGFTICSHSDEAPLELVERADLVLDGALEVVGFLGELAAELTNNR